MNRQQRRAIAKAAKDGPQAAEPTRGLNVMICVASHPQVDAFFSYDLAQMMTFTTRNFCKPGVIDNFGLSYLVGTYIHTARQQLAMAALNAGADYILFVDSDMRFPINGLVRLLQHQVPMVGVNYVRRGHPTKYIAIEKIASEDGGTSGGKLMETLPDSTGLAKVEALGFGFTLIRRDVFLTLPDPKEEPWFWFEWMPSRNGQIGEDVFFCRKVRSAGMDVLLDHDLSKEIQHTGRETFRLDHAWALAEQEAQDGGDNQLHDADSGDRGRSEQDRPDGDDPGIPAESGSETPEGRPGEDAGRPDSPLRLV